MKLVTFEGLNQNLFLRYTLIYIVLLIINLFNLGKLIDCPSVVKKSENFTFSIEFIGFDQNLLIDYGDNTNIIDTSESIQQLIWKNITKFYESRGYYSMIVKDSQNILISTCLIEVQEITMICNPKKVYINETVYCNVTIFANKTVFSLNISFSDSKNNIAVELIVNNFYFNKSFENFGNFTIKAKEVNIGSNEKISVIGSNSYLNTC